MADLDALQSFEETEQAQLTPFAAVGGLYTMGGAESDAAVAHGTSFPPPTSSALVVQETLASPFYYMRYYVGHMGRHGNEFLEFEIKSDGTLKYANNSNYRKDTIIKKQVKLSAAVIEEIKRLVLRSQVLDGDDSKWPAPDRNGRQELEVHIGSTHISVATTKITLMEEIERSEDPEGMTAFYLCVRDIKALVLALIGLHFKIKAV